MKTYTITRKKLHKDEMASTGWEAAIAEAEGQIYAAQRKIAGLRQSIMVFKQRMNAGSPWPGVEFPSVREEENGR